MTEKDTEQIYRPAFYDQIVPWRVWNNPNRNKINVKCLPENNRLAHKTRKGQWASSSRLGKLWTILSTPKFWNLLTPYELQSLVSQTLSLTGGRLKNTTAFFRRFLQLTVSWTPSEDLQGANTYCLIINVSQMSTAAASAWSWLVSRNKWLIPPLCQLAVRHIIRGNPETSSMDAIHAVHFYLNGTGHSKSPLRKLKMIKARVSCIPNRS